MSEVTVYLASDLHPGEHVVLQPDFDSREFELNATLSQLAALREELAASNGKLEKIRGSSSHVDMAKGAYIPNSLDAWGRPVPQYLPYDFSGNPGASATQYCNGWNDAGGYWLNHINDLKQRLADAEQQNAELVKLLRRTIRSAFAPNDPDAWKAREELRAVLAQEAGPGEPATICGACIAGTSDPEHFDDAGKCRYTNQHPILKVLNDPQAMELVALKATVAQQAQMIEWLKNGAEQSNWEKGLEDSDGNELVTVRADEYARLKASPPAPVAVVHPFADKVISKLQRFVECTDDGQGADIGRHWFDILTHLGLLNRVQRSPALWEMTQQGEDVLDKVKELNQ